MANENEKKNENKEKPEKGRPRSTGRMTPTTTRDISKDTRDKI